MRLYLLNIRRVLHYPIPIQGYSNNRFWGCVGSAVGRDDGVVEVLSSIYIYIYIYKGKSSACFNFGL